MGSLPVVVALGSVDPALVAGLLDGHCRFVAAPSEADLAGAAAVAEGAIGMALHLVKRFGPLTALVREGRWARRAEVPVGDLHGRRPGRPRRARRPRAACRRQPRLARPPA